MLCLRTKVYVHGLLCLFSSIHRDIRDRFLFVLWFYAIGCLFTLHVTYLHGRSRQLYSWPCCGWELVYQFGSCQLKVTFKQREFSALPPPRSQQFAMAEQVRGNLSLLNTFNRPATSCRLKKHFKSSRSSKMLRLVVCTVSRDALPRTSLTTERLVERWKEGVDEGKTLV